MNKIRDAIIEIESGSTTSPITTQVPVSISQAAIPSFNVVNKHGEANTSGSNAQTSSSSSSSSSSTATTADLTVVHIPDTPPKTTVENLPQTTSLTRPNQDVTHGVDTSGKNSDTFKAKIPLQRSSPLLMSVQSVPPPVNISSPSEPPTLTPTSPRSASNLPEKFERRRVLSASTDLSMTSDPDSRRMSMSPVAEGWKAIKMEPIDVDSVPAKPTSKEIRSRVRSDDVSMMSSSSSVVSNAHSGRLDLIARSGDKQIASDSSTHHKSTMDIDTNQENTPGVQDQRPLQSSTSHTGNPFTNGVSSISNLSFPPTSIKKRRYPEDLNNECSNSNIPSPPTRISDSKRGLSTQSMDVEDYGPNNRITISSRTKPSPSVDDSNTSPTVAKRTALSITSTKSAESSPSVKRSVLNTMSMLKQNENPEPENPKSENPKSADEALKAWNAALRSVRLSYNSAKDLKNPQISSNNVANQNLPAASSVGSLPEGRNKETTVEQAQEALISKASAMGQDQQPISDVESDSFTADEVMESGSAPVSRLRTEPNIKVVVHGEEVTTGERMSSPRAHIHAVKMQSSDVSGLTASLKENVRRHALPAKPQTIVSP
ncbi:hypothetical protein BCR41DRAFT_371841 [Lobosporangium transversale]|uniref:Uncharacterized protein n=1 Tax=Lobosporangium transversale TaxID=64571 RepID=A0A1Y2GJC3_9FUNG|nr:hypothetical protein BCR41DRAFT_371841 [Lobosporangium transversale]ORZ12581.1 hypothetical protein BCR41DRAFT_371841 [Lobosporangium transversale]|eukprot:XP_021880200.1 hypothetical protein BCR41DRAFT_371841 [Lobosporangium transversale]